MNLKKIIISAKINLHFHGKNKSMKFLNVFEVSI